MKWILKGFNVRSTINRHILAFCHRKKVDQIATQGFSNLLVNVSLVQYFKGSDTYRCLI